MCILQDGINEYFWNSEKLYEKFLKTEEVDMGGGQDKDSEAGQDKQGGYSETVNIPEVPSIPTFEGPEKPSQVDHPEHYNRGTIETIDFIEDRQHLGFSRLNAIKYIDRSGAKIGESKEQSIWKAIWYLERELGIHKKGDL